MLKKIEGLTPQWDDGLSKHTASTKKSNCPPKYINIYHTSLICRKITYNTLLQCYEWCMRRNSSKRCYCIVTTYGSITLVTSGRGRSLCIWTINWNSISLNLIQVWLVYCNKTCRTRRTLYTLNSLRTYWTYWTRLNLGSYLIIIYIMVFPLIKFNVLQNSTELKKSYIWACPILIFFVVCWILAIRTISIFFIFLSHCWIWKKIAVVENWQWC